MKGVKGKLSLNITSYKLEIAHKLSTECSERAGHDIPVH